MLFEKREKDYEPRMNERGESGGGRRWKGEEKEIEKETMGVKSDGKESRKSRRERNAGKGMKRKRG